MTLKTALRCAVTPIIDLMPASWREHFFFENFNYDEHYAKNRGVRPEMIPVYREVVELAAREGRYVIDLGCGTGSFYSELATWRPRHTCIYSQGIDSCKTAIQVARRNNPGVDFLQADITNMPELRKLTDHTFVILEVLEHLKDDIGLLQRLPKGSFVIASVPTFYSWDHVRRFKNADAICKRYASVFAAVQVQKIDKWFVFYGITC